MARASLIVKPYTGFWPKTLSVCRSGVTGSPARAAQNKKWICTVSPTDCPTLPYLLWLYLLSVLVHLEADDNIHESSETNNPTTPIQTKRSAESLPCGEISPAVFNAQEIRTAEGTKKYHQHIFNSRRNAVPV